jgi:hypothetical protein
VRRRANMMHRRPRGEGGIGQAVVGETHEKAYVGLLLPTCAQPNEGQVALDHNLLKLGTYSYELKTFGTSTVGRLFNARRTHLLSS